MMHREDPSPLRPGEIARHFAVGSSLGALLVLTLAAGAQIRTGAMVVGPYLDDWVLPALVTLFALLFGVGAALTGAIFTSIERERRDGRRRG
jgi:ABC-type enterobactin transport system permease subunit